MKPLLLSILVLLLSGCAAIGSPYTPAPSPPENQSLVYIYRHNNFALGARDAYFYIDEINIADLSRNGYTWFYAPAGKHVLEQKWPIDVSMFSKLETSVNWEPGKTYYYQFFTTTGDALPGHITLQWQLSEVAKIQAEREMMETKLQPAFGAPKLLQGGVTQ